MRKRISKKKMVCVNVMLGDVQMLRPVFGFLCNRIFESAWIVGLDSEDGALVLGQLQP